MQHWIVFNVCVFVCLCLCLCVFVCLCLCLCVFVFVCVVCVFVPKGMYKLMIIRFCQFPSCNIELQNDNIEPYMKMINFLTTSWLQIADVCCVLCVFDITVFVVFGANSFSYVQCSLAFLTFCSCNFVLMLSLFVVLFLQLFVFLLLAFKSHCCYCCTCGLCCWYSAGTRRIQI